MLGPGQARRIGREDGFRLILRTDAPAPTIGDDPRVWRPSRTRLKRIGDAAIPWGVGLFLVLVVADEGTGLSTPLVLVGVALAAVSGAALRWRRRRPELAMAIALASGLGIWLLVPDIVLPVAALFAIASVAAIRPPSRSLLWLAALELLVAANFFTATIGDTFFTMGLAVGAWALGEATRTRRVAIQETARRAVGEEQARIARELHDVVAHSVSVIVVQAAAADDVFDARPDQARAALQSIERAGREALVELRRLLGAIRPGDAADANAPQPSLERLDELIEPVRAGGLSVTVRRKGAGAPLPAGVDLSAYRIVQEALTNTLRHARATHAEVTVHYGPDRVEVEVRDDGRGTPAGGARAGGNGLVGMRERASLLGGALEAGPLAGGGFRVHASLPVDGAL